MTEEVEVPMFELVSCPMFVRGTMECFANWDIDKKKWYPVGRTRNALEAELTGIALEQEDVERIERYRTHVKEEGVGRSRGLK